MIYEFVLQAPLHNPFLNRKRSPSETVLQGVGHKESYAQRCYTDIDVNNERVENEGKLDVYYE